MGACIACVCACGHAPAPHTHARTRTRTHVRTARAPRHPPRRAVVVDAPPQPQRVLPQGALHAAGGVVWEKAGAGLALGVVVAGVVRGEAAHLCARACVRGAGGGGASRGACGRGVNPYQGFGGVGSAAVRRDGAGRQAAGRGSRPAPSPDAPPCPAPRMPWSRCGRPSTWCTPRGTACSWGPARTQRTRGPTD